MDKINSIWRRLLALNAAVVGCVLSFSGCTVDKLACPADGEPALSPLSNEERTARLATIAEDVRALFDVPGLSVAIADTRDTVIVAASGLRRVDQPDLITTDDLLHIGSVTKPVTSTLIATLVEQGGQKFSFAVGSAGTFLCVCLVNHTGTFALAIGINASRSDADAIDQFSSELVTAIATQAQEQQIIP